MKVLLRGLGASSGKVEGRAKVVKEFQDFRKLEDGDILVTPMTNPGMIGLIQRARAIVTDYGGIASHPAIVAREFGIPCVVGTNEATRILSDGMEIIVDGEEGIVCSKA